MILWCQQCANTPGPTVRALGSVEGSQPEAILRYQEPGSPHRLRSPERHLSVASLSSTLWPTVVLKFLFSVLLYNNLVWGQQLEVKLGRLFATLIHLDPGQVWVPRGLLRLCWSVGDWEWPGPPSWPRPTSFLNPLERLWETCGKCILGHVSYLPEKMGWIYTLSVNKWLISSGSLLKMEEHTKLSPTVAFCESTTSSLPIDKT